MKRLLISLFAGGLISALPSPVPAQACYPPNYYGYTQPSYYTGSHHSLGSTRPCPDEFGYVSASGGRRGYRFLYGRDGLGSRGGRRYDRGYEMGHYRGAPAVYYSDLEIAYEAPRDYRRDLSYPSYVESDRPRSRTVTRRGERDIQSWRTFESSWGSGRAYPRSSR